MDTQTVLDIIKMLDNQINNLEEAEDIWQEELHFGVKHLSFIRDHLQSFIEGQLNAMENQTGE